jgi:hypothetical protein
MSALIRPRIRHSMTLAAAARRRIQQFGPYKSLAVLLVPRMVVEPVKMTGVAFVGLRHWVGGACMIVGAYAAGILVVDRFFRVIKSKLYTMRWCALLAQKFQEYLGRPRRALQRSSEDPARVQRIRDLEEKISP